MLRYFIFILKGSRASLAVRIQIVMCACFLSLNPVADKKPGTSVEIGYKDEPIINRVLNFAPTNPRVFLQYNKRRRNMFELLLVCNFFFLASQLVRPSFRGCKLFRG